MKKERNGKRREATESRIRASHKRPIVHNGRPFLDTEHLPPPFPSFRHPLPSVPPPSILTHNQTAKHGHHYYSVTRTHRMHNDAPPNHAQRPIQRQQLILEIQHRDARGVALDVAKVADMSDFIGGRTVRAAKGVKVRRGGGAT